MRILFFLRSFLAVIPFVLWTILLTCFGVSLTLLTNQRQIGTLTMQLWSQAALRLWGVKVEVKGRENIPPGSCLFLFNHTSFFDIFAMVVAYSDFRFGAKIELFAIPFVGLSMKKFGVLPIARGRREEVFRVYEEAKVRVLNGEKFALSPEGGRNDEEKLLPFKAGPFLFAINSGMPLVPVIIKGARAVMSKGAILPNLDCQSRTITVEYLPQISVEGVGVEQRTELQEKVFAAMKPYFKET